MTLWADLAARARGLGTHLLSRRDLELLTRAPDLASLGDALRRAGFPLAERGATPEEMELAVRRRAAAALRVVARWCGARTAMVRIIFEEEDRRSLRALLRGAVEGAPPALRLSGLVPTPALPERSLGELARLGSPSALATLLTVWDHPYGPPLRSVIGQAHPDLLRLEAMVNRTYAMRALAGARWAGRRSGLLAYVQESIDLENAVTAVALAGASDVAAKDLFLHGGERVSLDAFETAVGLGAAQAAIGRLAVAFASTPLAAVFRSAPAPDVLEERVLRARMAALRRTARRFPLGPAALLGFALRLRAQGIDVSRTIWGLALGAPPALLADALVSPV